LRWLLGLFVAHAVLLALVGLPYKFSGEKLLLGRFPVKEWYFYSSFIYHNHWAAYALLAQGAALGLFFSSPQRWMRALTALAVGVLFASTLIASARLGALLTGGLGAAALVVAWRHAATRPRSRRALLIGGLAGLLLVVGATAWLMRSGPGPGGHRTYASLLKNNPFTSRFHLVEDTWQMVRAKPVFGWGLGAFASGFRIYQRPETRIVHNNGRITLYDHPHNDWMEKLAELGFVGFSLLALPLVAWLAPLRHRDSQGRDPLFVWPLAACGLLFVMAWGDSIFANRSVLGITAFLLPLLLHQVARRTPATVTRLSHSAPRM
jgi:O-antigen ligase